LEQEGLDSDLRVYSLTRRGPGAWQNFVRVYCTFVAVAARKKMTPVDDIFGSPPGSLSALVIPGRCRVSAAFDWRCLSEPLEYERLNPETPGFIALPVPASVRRT